jgi:pSer/pThr/pTyr-binding forkhead associated (FHA) protein
MNNEQSHILITKGLRAGEKIGLSNLPVTIGRDATANFQMDVRSVSREHAKITRTADGYAIENLSSQNGTFVNEQHIHAVHPLKNGDLIALGPDVEMRVVIPVTKKAVPPTESDKTVAFQQAVPPVESDKTIAFQQIDSLPTIPPRLVINESGKDSKVITLTADRVKMGRQEDNDIVLENRFVSRNHAELEKRGQDYYIIPSPHVSNSLLLDGQPVMAPTRLSNGAKIRVGGYAPGEMVSLDYLSSAAEGQQVIKFEEKRLMSIGRDPSNAIVLDAPVVSRFHAELEQVGQRFRVRDLHSSNGTYVNGRPVTGETWVHPGGAIQIGPYRFVVAEGEFSQSDQSESVSVDVYNLSKRVSKSLNILQDISLSFKPKEFVVVVGQSGGGKSTLVDAIAGYRLASHGRVIVNKTINVYKEFDAIRSSIGYVPQRDMIHMELTVFQALNYAAQLRMPADTTVAERVKRIEEVMEDLDLSHRRDTQISKLSGGQQKRVSIGVELLTKPGLFFLDEPTSGLDPGMETELMRLMRRLADRG